MGRFGQRTFRPMTFRPRTFRPWTFRLRFFAKVDVSAKQYLVVIYMLFFFIGSCSLIANILYIVVDFFVLFLWDGVGWEERVHEGHVCFICFKIYFKIKENGLV